MLAYANITVYLYLNGYPFQLHLMSPKNIFTLSHLSDIESNHREQFFTLFSSQSYVFREVRNKTVIDQGYWPLLKLIRKCWRLFSVLNRTIILVHQFSRSY